MAIIFYIVFYNINNKLSQEQDKLYLTQARLESVSDNDSEKILSTLINLLDLKTKLTVETVGYSYGSFYLVVKYSDVRDFNDFRDNLEKRFAIKGISTIDEINGKETRVRVDVYSVD